MRNTDRLSLSLTLLDGVAFDGVAVPGARPQALLATLAAAGGRTVAAGELVDAVWGDDPPANAAKALHVVVSRTRAVCGGEVIARDGEGYRLAVAGEEVDSLRLAELVACAQVALPDDAPAALRLAGQAVRLADGAGGTTGGGDGPLAALRQSAAEDVARARVIAARAQARTGDGPAALALLQDAWAADGADESLLADLLRAEAAVRGPARALERFEAYRRALRETAGAEPGAELGQMQRTLLASDSPVREGVRFDATELLGRDDDVRSLRGLLQSARVVSILGPGGLGKTRLAHVVAREAPQPSVWVVELVAITSPDDVVGEVGSVLGVRDSVTGRQALSPRQRADLRGRIAQQLGQAPSLLVLDNCEHLVEAVASLVAFLVSATPDLRVLTTSRAPLQIAAEQVYPLGQLGADDAAELFVRRARAARPGVRLDDAVVRRVAERLDGLPLAIELAAAKVRSLSLEDVDRRLEDRFALLRGGDRGAPDRHQTLLAVIDWSWNLLEEPERRALRWLSVFHDGFTVQAAEAVLGADAGEAVERLTDQSLVALREDGGGLRHRMLETVREFGRMQLRAVGEEDAAVAAHQSWAVAFAARHGARLAGVEQFSAMDVVAAEEANLADALRVALAGGRPGLVAPLAATLGGFWSLRGEHGRLMVLSASIAAALSEWTPPPELRDTARTVAMMWMLTGMMALDEQVPAQRDLLDRLAAEPSGDPTVAASARVMGAWTPAEPERLLGHLDALAGDPDRRTARIALMWSSHAAENAGDLAEARRRAERSLALTRPEDGPWASAWLRTHLAELTASLGQPAAAIAHATAALPTLDRLGARDDRMQARALMACCAVSLGRLDEARAQIAAIDASGDLEAAFGSQSTVAIARAEVGFAAGDVASGLAAREGVLESMRTLAFPGVPQTGIEPWVLRAEAWALTVTVRHGGPGLAAEADRLAAQCVSRAQRALREGDAFLDLPAVGQLLFALATWRLADPGQDPEPGLVLLALADAFAYTRSIPSLAWEPMRASAERRAPGLLVGVRSDLPGDVAALRDRALGAVTELEAATV